MSEGRFEPCGTRHRDGFTTMVCLVCEVEAAERRAEEAKALNERLKEDLKTGTEHSYAEGVKAGCEEVSVEAAKMLDENIALRARIEKTKQALQDIAAGPKQISDPMFAGLAIQKARQALSSPDEPHFHAGGDMPCYGKCWEGS